MFYDHRILTERKYGIATVWLVATLGNKTTVSKKVQKREILDVNLNKACNTILNPEAPLALRLQSNLLYGVSRVFKEQYHYFYADVNQAHAKLSKDIIAWNLDNINLPRENSRPENLLLQDDPAFVPGLAFHSATQDLAAFFTDGDISGSTVDSSPGPTTPGSANRSGSTISATGKYQLHIPSSSVSGGGGFMLDNFSIGDDSFPASNRSHDLGFQADLDFEFDENGELRPIASQDRASQLDGGDGVTKQPKQRRARSPGAESDDLAQQRVLEDMGGGHRAIRDLGGDLEFEMPIMDYDQDGAYNLPANASPLPERQQAPLAAADMLDDVPMDLDQPNEIPQRPQKLARPKKRVKKNAFDEVTLIPQKTLAEWQNNYLENMHVLNEKKKQSKKDKDVKAYAKQYVLQIQDVPKPLAGLNDMVQQLLMKKLGVATAKQDGADNKPAALDMDDGAIPLNVGMDDDIVMPNMEDEAEIGLGGDLPPVQDTPLEVGRHDPLPDSVATMPWNISARNSRAGSIASMGGFNAGGVPSSSVGGGGGSHLPSSARRGYSRPPFNRVGSQMTPMGRSRVSASPLVGPGAHGLSDESGDFLMPEYEDDQLAGLDKFEYYGVSADQPTQRAQGSQWRLEAMEAEGQNFLGYLQNKIEEQQELDLDATESVNDISFNKLVEPKDNSYIVAAQAFHHTLSLATKGFLRIKQEYAYGDIKIQLLVSVH